MYRPVSLVLIAERNTVESLLTIQGTLIEGALFNATLLLGLFAGATRYRRNVSRYAQCAVTHHSPSTLDPAFHCHYARFHFSCMACACSFLVK